VETLINLYLAYLITVTDGDTFKARVPVWNGVEIVTAVRVNGIDAPELRGKCDFEKVKAEEASAALAHYLQTAKSVTLQNVKDDKYSGRVVADVIVDGKSLSSEMIRTGLVRPYNGGTRAGWCKQ
jgi:endonuclease YncB( thermonuclease family)